jgi:hypothetical protein
MLIKLTLEKLEAKIICTFAVLIFAQFSAVGNLVKPITINHF